MGKIFVALAFASLAQAVDQQERKIATEVEDFFKVNGVQTNEAVTREDLLKGMNAEGLNETDKSWAADYALSQIDKDYDGKITYQEAFDHFKKQDEEEKKVQPAALLQTEGQAEAAVQKVDASSLAGAQLDASLTSSLDLSEGLNFTMGMGMTAEALTMKGQLMASLQHFMEAEEKQKIADKEKREKRWASILHRQQQALLQHEQALKSEEKELQKMQRETEFKKSEAAKENAQASNCAGQKAMLQAFVSSSESHASCLKTQLGACITTELTASLSLKCDEPSAGWQKKCLAEKAEQMSDCAPLGVDWNALRRGETGNAADNAALERLGEWCTFHKTLGKIAQNTDAQTPFSLILSKDSALSKDAVQKLSDFGSNFKQQQWDLLQVDPVGHPAPLHSVLVKNDAAEKLQKAMSQMKAVPLDKMPKAVNDAGVAKAVSWTAGVSGMLERESADCSLQSPALLKAKEEGKLVAALR